MRSIVEGYCFALPFSMKNKSTHGVIFVGHRTWAIAKPAFGDGDSDFLWTHPDHGHVEYRKYYDYATHGEDKVYPKMCTRLGYDRHGNKGDAGKDYHLAAPYVVVFLDENRIPEDEEEALVFLSDIIRPMSQVGHTCETRNRFLIDPKRVFGTGPVDGVITVTTRKEYDESVRLDECGEPWLALSRALFGFALFPTGWGDQGDAPRERIALAFCGKPDRLEIYLRFMDLIRESHRVTQVLRSQTCFYLFVSGGVEYVAPLIDNPGHRERVWSLLETDSELRCSRIIYVPLDARQQALDGFDCRVEVSPILDLQWIDNMQDWRREVVIAGDEIDAFMVDYFERFDSGLEAQGVCDSVLVDDTEIPSATLKRTKYNRL